jgi:type I restriction enzyme S subunit
MFGEPVTNPKGWNSKAIESVADIVGGGTPPKANPSFWNGCIPWVSPKDMRELIITNTQDHITDEAIKNSATSLVPQLSILIVFRSGILVHSVPLALAGTELAINQDMKALIPKTKELDSFYLLAWLLTSEQTLLACVKRGATVHSIDGNKFKTLPIILPAQEMQERFSRMFREILGVGVSRRSSARKLNSLFSLLLRVFPAGTLDLPH